MKDKFERFVASLSEEQVRGELVSAYVMMERCQQLLKGEKVEPVDMMDNGESSDLELFYRCRKAREELDYLNGMLAKCHVSMEDEDDGK